jgi:transposase
MRRTSDSACLCSEIQSRNLHPATTLVREERRRWPVERWTGSGTAPCSSHVCTTTALPPSRSSDAPSSSVSIRSTRPPGFYGDGFANDVLKEALRPGEAVIVSKVGWTSAIAVRGAHHSHRPARSREISSLRRRVIDENCCRPDYCSDQIAPPTCSKRLRCRAIARSVSRVIASIAAARSTRELPPGARDTRPEVAATTGKDALVPAPHPKEFRQRAVELARQKTKPVAELAKELRISESCLRTWLAQADVDDNGSATQLTSKEKKELAELRRDKSAGWRWKSRFSSGRPPIMPERSPKIVFPLVRQLADDDIDVAVACRVLNMADAGRT